MKMKETVIGVVLAGFVMFVAGRSTSPKVLKREFKDKHLMAAKQTDMGKTEELDFNSLPTDDVTAEPMTNKPNNVIIQSEPTSDETQSENEIQTILNSLTQSASLPIFIILSPPDMPIPSTQETSAINQHFKLTSQNVERCLAGNKHLKPVYFNEEINDLVYIECKEKPIPISTWEAVKAEKGTEPVSLIFNPGPGLVIDERTDIENGEQSDLNKRKEEITNEVNSCN